MAFQQKLLILTALAVVIAVAVLSKARGTPPTAGRASLFGVPASLAVVVGALVAVGLVSHTLVRHIIQIVPLIAALVLAVRGSPWAESAAASLFAFWFLLMGAIWLFLLGAARIVSGRFTPAEIALTIVIGAASLLGLGSAYGRATRIALVLRVAAIAAFAFLQFTAMWLSLQPFVATR